MSRARRRPVQEVAPEGASLYVRLSRAASEENLSRDGMLADVRELAARHRLPIVAEHVDDGLSGAIRNRPEFVAWLDDAREGRASTLIAWHVDRMTREGVNVAALILDTIEGKDPETGAVVRPPVRLLDTKGLDSSGDEAAFRFRFVIAAEVARAERERMRDRSAAAHRRAREAGRWPGGPAPFGFRIVDNPDGPGRVLEPDPEEAAALRHVAGLLMAGESLSSAVRWLNAHGPAPRRAAHWTRKTVSQSLTSESTSTLLFSPAERRAVAQVFRPTGSRPGRQPSRLLSGVLLCHSCGRALRSSRNGRRSAVVSYRCPSGFEGAPCDRKVSVSALPAEAAISRLWLDGWGSLPETIVSREVDSRADRLALLADEIDEAASAVVSSRGASRTEALARLEALEEEQAALEAEPVSTVTVIRETGRTYADAWHAADTRDRRALLLRTAGRLTILPGARGRKGFNEARIANPWRLDPAETDAAEVV